MSREDRFRDRSRGRFRGLHGLRLGLLPVHGELRLLPCIHGGFRGGSLCDISTPGSNYLRCSQASRELCGPLTRCLALTSPLGALPLELAALRVGGTLALHVERAAVTSLVAGSSVADRVVAGRRSLLLCARRSALAVVSCAAAGLGAVSGRPGQPSPGAMAALRIR